MYTVSFPLLEWFYPMGGGELRRDREPKRAISKEKYSGSKAEGLGYSSKLWETGEEDRGEKMKEKTREYWNELERVETIFIHM